MDTYVMQKLSTLSNTLQGSSETSYLYIGSQAAGKIISLLRGALYSDKWGSLIREVVSNAWDANVEAGYEGPVEVYLPGAISDELLIKDKGKGMSPYFLENHYTNVGHSTKENDYSQVGAFGLGRLTPLLVCDSYKVETCYEGKKYVYTMAIGERDGLVKVYEGDAQGDVGTSIRIPCTYLDKGDILGALRSWCCYMQPLPLIDGEPLEVLPQVEPYPGCEGKDYWASVCNSGITVLNGWVPYRLRSEYNPSAWKELIKPAYAHYASSRGMTIRFNPGEINVTASREDIEYTTQTLNAIERRLSEAIKDLRESSNKYVEKAPDLRTALLIGNQLPPAITSVLSWKGYRLSMVELKACNVGAIRYSFGRKGDNLVGSKDRYQDIIRHKHVLIDDIENPVNRNARVRSYIKEHRSEVFLVPLEVLTRGEESREGRIAKAMNWPLLSSLPEPDPLLVQATPKKLRNNDIKVGKAELKAYEWIGYSSTFKGPNMLKFTKPVAIPIDQGGVCVVVKNGSITKGFHDRLPSDTLISDLRDFLPSNRKPLYVIPESSYERTEGKWVFLEDEVLRLLGTKLDTYLEVLGGAYFLADKPTQWGKVSWRSWDYRLNVLQGFSQFVLQKVQEGTYPRDTLLVKYIEESQRIVREIEQHHQAIWVAGLIGKDVPKERPLKTLYEQVMEKYPLLSFLERAKSGDTTHNYLIDYIKGIDSLG